METLYTGFKGANNSSHILVSQINGEKLFLTNSYSGLRKDIDNLNKNYNRVYMFGLDKSLRNSVRIEACAQKDGSILRSAMELKNIEERFIIRGLKCWISENPTWYLCDEAYFYMLKKYNQNAVFIHVPSARYLSNEFVEAIISALVE